MTTTVDRPEKVGVQLPLHPPRRKRARDYVTLALGGWSVLVYAFLFLPIVFVIAYSFNKGNALLLWKGFGAHWYSDALHNKVILAAVRVSIKVGICSAAVAVVLGSLAGVALARRGGGWVKPFLAMLFLILVTPEIVDAIAYLIWFVRLGWIFSGSWKVNPLGWLGDIFDAVGGSHSWVDFANFNGGFVRLIVGHSIFSSAVVTLIVRARLSGLDESLEEAAADLGAPPHRAFRQITLPLMMPAVLAGALLSFTFSLDNTIVSSFVSVAGTTTFPVYIFSARHSVLKPEVFAVSTIMLGVTMFSLAVVALVMRRAGDSAEQVATTLAGG